jgi:hypothetical protein
VSQAYSVIALPDLKVSASTLATRIQPNDTQTTTVSVSNLTPATPAHDVRVLFTPVNGATVTAIDLLAGPPGSQCVASGNSAQCSIPELARGSVFAHPEVMTARVTLRAPQRSDGGKIGLRISASSAENDFDLTDNTAEVTTSLVRQLVVSHTGDSGLGSLRQAILDSQTQCATDPCRINFEIRLATPKNGWFTIHPFTPLPPVSGVVEINASSQVAISGAPVANGPAIELRGDLQREGDGLTVLGGCEVTITGLAINSFPVHAISAGGLPPRACTLVLPTGGPLTISRNFIGLDPTGSAVLPNYRGIWIGNVGGVRISDNFIGGNVRSAIFLADKFTSSSVNGNRIGVTIDGKPAPNGATGIYIHGEGTISDNVIANGGEFGIAVDPAPTSHVGIHRNLIYDNQHTAIDQGLDLETPNRKDAGGTFANKPILIDAVYQPENGTTVIRGRLDSDPASTIGPQYVLEFFAAKSLSKGGHAQAERYLGSLTPKSGHEDFEFTAKGDLRGQLIAATSSRSFYNGFGIPDGGGTTAEFLINPEDTSELSDPVQVR